MTTEAGLWKKEIQEFIILCTKLHNQTMKLRWCSVKKYCFPGRYVKIIGKKKFEPKIFGFGLKKPIDLRFGDQNLFPKNKWQIRDFLEGSPFLSPVAVWEIPAIHLWQVTAVTAERKQGVAIISPHVPSGETSAWLLVNWSQLLGDFGPEKTQTFSLLSFYEILPNYYWILYFVTAGLIPG
jgi:hypothetical protein